MPVAAVVTLLTKMQNDVRYIEGEVLSTLIANIDEKDFRVNKVEALVIPKSQVVTNGMPFEAQLVLAAVDSTRQPEYYFNGKLLESDRISIASGSIGEHKIAGEIISDGITYPYSTSYSVTASSATVAPVLMKFLYEDIDNDVEIAMSGVPSGAIRASIEGSGSISLKANNVWTIKGLDMAKSPTVNVILSANVGGRNISEKIDFKVRPLPQPAPFLSYKDENGTTQKYYVGLITRRRILEARGVEAAIDDGVLDIKHTVTGFTTSFIDGKGMTVREVSNSGEFTQRQKEFIQNLARGKSFYISDIKAVNPAGRTVSIRSAMEIRVN